MRSLGLPAGRPRGYPLIGELGGPRGGRVSVDGGPRHYRHLEDDTRARRTMRRDAAARPAARRHMKRPGRSGAATAVRLRSDASFLQISSATVLICAVYGLRAYNGPRCVASQTRFPYTLNAVNYDVRVINRPAKYHRRICASTCELNWSLQLKKNEEGQHLHLRFK